MMPSLLIAAAVLAAQATPSAAVTAGTVIRSEANGALEGYLLTPAGKPKATMLIIPGSGPTDRDGNNPNGVKAGPYRKLAEALVARRVATLRIDKRGMFGSAGAGNPSAATFAEYDGDVRAWVETARRRTGQKCVWVAGHSEGGLVAMRAAAGPNVCGIVLLAAPGERLGDTIRKQLRASPERACARLGREFAERTRGRAQGPGQRPSPCAGARIVQSRGAGVHDRIIGAGSGQAGSGGEAAVADRPRRA